MRLPKLSDADAAARLSDLPGWTINDNAIEKTFVFADFAEAMRFVNRLADAAEAADHHPDLDIRYNKVHVLLTTHDSGGLTENDFALAGEAELPLPPFPSFS